MSQQHWQRLLVPRLAQWSCKPSLPATEAAVSSWSALSVPGLHAPGLNLHLPMQAPGYFTVVQRAMDFTTLARQVAAGVYASWGTFLADLELMFTNALKYNPPDTIYHKQVQAQAHDEGALLFSCLSSRAS